MLGRYFTGICRVKYAEYCSIFTNKEWGVLSNIIIIDDYKEMSYRVWNLCDPDTFASLTVKSFVSLEDIALSLLFYLGHAFLKIYNSAMVYSSAC